MPNLVHIYTEFVSSYMECEKYQEIDLTEHFSEAYLDTAPEIQVGCLFYSMLY